MHKHDKRRCFWDLLEKHIQAWSCGHVQTVIHIVWCTFWTLQNRSGSGKILNRAILINIPNKNRERSWLTFVWVYEWSCLLWALLKECKKSSWELDEKDIYPLWLMEIYLFVKSMENVQNSISNSWPENGLAKYFWHGRRSISQVSHEQLTLKN